MSRRNVNVLKLKGFMRAQIIGKRKKVIGDSGWLANQLTNYGFSNCFALRPMNAGQSINSMILGSASTPASTDITLTGGNTGQNSSIVTAMAGTAAGTWTARITQQFKGANSSMTTLGNVGLLAGATNQLAAGVGFATSSLGTDQSVNVTYDLQFS